MPVFKLVSELGGGTYIAQVSATSPRAALNNWLDRFDFAAFPRLHASDAEKLRQALEEDVPVPVENVRNVWCVSGISPRGLLLVHIIKTHAK